jgi:hypothetical protein
MNHQNQNRTNGIWGHVRYNLPVFGDLWQHKQSKHKFAKLTKLESLTLAWMLTIIQTLPRSNFRLFDLLFLCSHIACLFHFGNTSLLWSTFPPFGIKSPKISQNKMSPRKLASPSKHSSTRYVKYKGESRMNHDSYVWYQWRYHMCEKLRWITSSWD